MVDVEQIIPAERAVDAQELVEDLRHASISIRPFDQRVIDFLGDLAGLLRRAPEVRQFPAIGALAYWIRPAAVARLREEWEANQSHSVTCPFVPRGVAFHLPPSNVDTLFAYSWALSALAGNGNIVRLSESSINSATGGPDTTAGQVVLSAIQRALKNHPVVAQATAFVRYGHEEEVTEELSGADLRIIWGGDESVRAIRAVPMNPLGLEVAFADRFSLSAFKSEAVAALAEDELDALVRRFFTDSYWFDQLGCSSPRLVAWVGEHQLNAEAKARFEEALQLRVEEEDYQTPTGAVMNKLVRAAVMASDGTASEVRWANPDLTIVEQPADAPFDRDFPGGGLFAFRSFEDLADLVPWIERRDQTLSHFGFSAPDLHRLVRALNGRGIDRVVPVGQALQFDKIWDGLDLLRTFARQVSIHP